MNFYLLSSILFVFVTLGKGDEWNMIHFPELIEVLKCFATSSVWDSLGGNKEWKKFAINYFRNEFFRRSMSKVEIKTKVAVIVQDLISNFDSQLIQLSRLEAEKSLEGAILHCSYQSDPISRPSMSNDPNIHRLPYFAWEQDRLRDILDLLLVRWRCLPGQMFSTPYRIATVQSYVERVMELMDSVHSSYGEHYDLDEDLMRMFFQRSSFFFDAYDELISYIDQFYSLDRKEPCAQGDIRKYLKRMSLLNRNQFLPLPYVERLLRIYVVDPRSDGTEYDYYSQYNQGINAISYYYENRKTFLSRVILAVFELLESNVLTYGDVSVKDDSIVANVTERAIKIMSDDDYFAQYLLDKKWEEILKSAGSNVFVKYLKQNRRVSVFHLIMSIWKRIKNNIKRATTTSTTSTTTYSFSESSTPEYEESNKRKDHFKKIGGKCYPKNRRQNNGNGAENSGQSCQKRSEYSQRSKDTIDEYSEYVMSRSNDEHFFLESLQDTFSSIVKGELSVCEGLSCFSS